ncbi:MAG: Holliday junction branch migration protein RuvA [bacterium]|nr:Holliday junction branch migration protein RuvA [bacterium]
MISFLQGIILEKSPTKLLINVNGVGFDVNITLPCFESLAAIGEKTTIITYLYVREDALQLYGFKSAFEREMFFQLITTPGIGPRKAQVILSSVSAEYLQQFIVEENLTALTSLSGVGKKTAQRLILDLKDKLLPLSLTSEKPLPFETATSEIKRLMDESLSALISLGFNKTNAQTAIQKVIQQVGKEITVEELIKNALRLL